MTVPMCDLERPFCTSGGPFAHLSIAHPMCVLGCPFRTSPNESGERPPFFAPLRPRHGDGRRAVSRPLAGPLFHSARLSAREGALPCVACPSPPSPKFRFPCARVPPHVQQGCAEGTSQIAHRNSEPALKDFFYVRFGTSLLHIRHPSPMSNLERPFCTCSRARGRSGPTGVRKERRSALPCAGWCGEQGCGRASRGAERRARPFLIGRSADLRGTPRMTRGRNAPDST